MAFLVEGHKLQGHADKTAFKAAALFPGQGSQYVGMGKAAYESFPAVREAFAAGSDALGLDLAKICFEGPKDLLDATEFTQPALLVLSYGLYKVLEDAGFRPRMAAGLSLGEYSALVAAGAMDFVEAVKLVRLRGKFMQEAVPPGRGGMAAVIGLDRDRVLEACREASSRGVVEPANYNSPAQVVISGEIEALELAMALAREMGARRVTKLHVSAPFHCSLMAPAAEKLAAKLADVRIRPPAFPVVSNAWARPLSRPEEIRESLIAQVASPVLWEESMGRLLDEGISTFVEIGPGDALRGLLKRIRPERERIAFGVEGPEDVKKFKGILECPMGGVLA